MCDFFSAIVFKSGDVRFCESDSHEVLIQRLDLDDTRSVYGRPWVRVECTGDEPDDVQIDEEYCPSWVDADRMEFNERVLRARARLLPLYELKQRMIRDTEEQLNKEYHEIEARYDRVYAVHSNLACWPDEEGGERNLHDDVIKAAQHLNRLETEVWQQKYDATRNKPFEAYAASMQSFFGYTPEPDAKPTEELGAEAEDDDSRDAGNPQQDDEV